LVTRLLVLWLLSEQPHHGYRIKKILGEESLRFWFPVEAGSIYAVLSTLVKAGLVETEAVEREGQRPERTRYRITKEGRSHFRDLLRQAWREAPRAPDPIFMSLAARSELDEREIAELMNDRAEMLRTRLSELDKAARSAPAAEMVDLRRSLTMTELEWLQGLIYKPQSGERPVEEGEA
jgi:DNA-binding PadR family transcriptional regulator